MIHHIGEVLTSACLLRLSPCTRSVELFRSLPGDLRKLRIPVYNRRLQIGIFELRRASFRSCDIRHDPSHGLLDHRPCLLRVTADSSFHDSGVRDDVELGSRGDLSDRNDQRIQRIIHTAHNVLESEQDRARRDDRVLSEMRHGAVGRNAVDRDLKVVTACHQLSIFDKDLSGRACRPHMHSHRRVDPFQISVIHIVMASDKRLFRRLKQEFYSSL